MQIKLKLQAEKWNKRQYFSHSGHVGGVRETTLAEMLAKKPTDVITLAVKGMLPKGPLGRAMIKNYMYMQDLSILMQLRSRKH
jgi:Ribosomal protein L13